MKKLLAILLLCSLAVADTAGPFSGTATGASWTNPANVGASDNAYATYVIPAETFDSGTGELFYGRSDPIYISTLGFAIPATATVTGITSSVERKCSATLACSTTPNADSAGNFCGVWLTKTAGTSQGTNKGSATFWSSTDVTDTLGGAADLWGASWPPADVNSNGFGLMMTVCNSYRLGTRTASVDLLAVTVSYTAGGAGSHRRVILSQTRSIRLRHSNV